MKVRNWALAGLLYLGAESALACSCDQCSLYLGRSETKGTIRTGLFAQYANLVQRIEGSHEEDAQGEKMESLNLQAYLAYRVSPRLTLQLNIPYIDREYTQRQDGALKDGSVSGLGDVSVLARYAFLDGQGTRAAWRVEAVAGLKLPTGDTDHLRPEGEAHTDAGDAPAAGLFAGHAGVDHAAESAPTEEESIIHDHNLALGSGSVDGILGLTARAIVDRWYARGLAEYFLRTEGDFEYRYGNDLMLGAAGGWLFLAQEGRELGTGVHVVYETREADEQDGESIPNTEVRSLYVGPHVDWTSRAFDTGVALDLPVSQHSAGTSLVPDYRVRATVGWTF